MTNANATNENKGAEYTFSGEYYCRETDGYITKNYELSIVFPELLQAPLSVFKKGVLTPNHPIHSLMLKKYPDYSSVRTYNVIKVVNNTDKKPKKENDINIMDIEQLKVYIKENCLNIDTAIYYDAVDKVRGAISLAENSPEKFEVQYAEDLKEFNYNLQLLELNKNNPGETQQKQTKNADKKQYENEQDGIDDLLGDLDNEGKSGKNDKQ